jgi:hypothetical protein
MISLALASLIFGVAASLTFSAAPFVAGNLLAIICIFGLGLVQHWSWLHIAANLFVGIVALQAGFVAGMVGKLMRARQSARRPHRGEGAAKLRRDASTMDRTR